jgi:hypothetical protein
MRLSFQRDQSRARLAPLATGLLALASAAGCGSEEAEPASTQSLNETLESSAEDPVRYSGIELSHDLERVFIKVDSNQTGLVEGQSTLDCDRSGDRVQSHPGFESPKTPFVQKIDLKGRPAVEGTSDCVLSGSVRLRDGAPDGQLTVTVTDQP